MLNGTLKYLIACIVVSIFASACQKKIDLGVKPNQTQLVVEAYINNLMADYNYVVISKSQDYFTPNFQSAAVENAIVSITEGTRDAANNLVWDSATKIILQEANTNSLPLQFRRGVYFDPKIFSNPLLALKGKIGKSYLLQIETDGKQYRAITTLITPIPVDSITTGFKFINDSNQIKVRITNHYKDSDTIGNRQFYYWRDSSNRNNFGWGGLKKSGWPGDDNFTNGENIRLTHSQEFNVKDTVQYFMASVTREVYTFWDSYNKAENNNGPFSTPVSLITNITGENVTGCFSGLALSTTTIITK